MYIPSTLWDATDVSSVDQLPHDIDGTKVYKLPFDPDERMKSSQDGRPWNKYFNSKRKDFHGIRRLATCKGGWRCDMLSCSFRLQHGVPNKHHFSNNTCKYCNMPAERVFCQARKVWEFDDSHKVVTIYHYGNHSCSVKPSKSKELQKKVMQQFKENSKLLPCQVASQNIIAAINEENWEQLDSIGMQLGDLQHTKNLKKKAMKELHPGGHSFEAVAIFKQTTDKRDKYLIYEINDRRLNGEQSYVFKTSKFKLELANSMNKAGEHSLNKEYAHVDGKENRCPGFTTVSVSMYHSLMQRQVPLAIMEAESERCACISKFWSLLDKALVSMNMSPFNPFGLISDEAGAFWNAAIAHFDEETIANSVSCEFHFKENVVKHTAKFGSEEDKLEFKDKCFKWMEATTTAGKVTKYRGSNRIKM